MQTSVCMWQNDSNNSKMHSVLSIYTCIQSHTLQLQIFMLEIYSSEGDNDHVQLL